MPRGAAMYCDLPWGTHFEFNYVARKRFVSPNQHLEDTQGVTYGAEGSSSSLVTSHSLTQAENYNSTTLPLNPSLYGARDDWGRYVPERDSTHLLTLDSPHLGTLLAEAQRGKLSTHAHDAAVVEIAKKLSKAEQDDHHIKSIHRQAARCGGVLFGLTAEECSVCLEKTIERFPCAGAHPYCVNCRKANEDADTEQCALCRGQYEPCTYAAEDGGSNNGRDPRWYDQMFLPYRNPKLMQLKNFKPSDIKAMSALSEDEQSTVRDLTKVDTPDMWAMSDVLCAPCDTQLQSGGKRGCYCMDPDKFKAGEPCKCNMRTEHREYLHSAKLVQVMEKKSHAFLDEYTKNRVPNSNLRAKARWKKAMEAERQLKKCLRTSGASYAASQDQAVELAFKEMRDAIYGWAERAVAIPHSSHNGTVGGLIDRLSSQGGDDHD